jgi:hypothetical protein
MITLLLSLTALTRDFGDLPKPHRLCRQDRVNACVQSEGALRQIELNAISTLGAQRAALEKEKNSLAENEEALQAEVRAAQVSRVMAEREAKTALTPAPSTEIFPGGPKPEELFFSGAANDWLEWHGTQRRSRLNSVVNSSEKRISALAPIQRNLATKISVLTGQMSALNGQITGHQQAAHAHESMCQNGCRDTFCPAD